MTSQEYIQALNRLYRAGNATEHTYRGTLAQLIESLLPHILVTNEPKRYKFGAPDYILTKKDIPVGFIEAKDIGDKDLYGKKKTGHKEQFDRYKASLDNIVFTDYLTFVFYRERELITEIAIGEIRESGIHPLEENFEKFENLIKDFTEHVIQSIKNPKRLAEMMAGKARLLFDVLNKSLTGDEENHEDSTLKDQMKAFRDILIHDITPSGFADVYAQTIVYGLFAARLHDPTIKNFSRQEAAELIPKSNPFLRRLFGYVAGPDIDDRIKWIVDNLVKVFLHCNVEKLLRNYGKATQTDDPIIHFYETFLSKYNPKLRKSRGVWYTPGAVVNFIVRAVDDILKTEFGLSKGLTDTSKTKIKVNTDNIDKRSSTGYKQIEKEVHRVQILDPATGTGTFLAEVVKQVFKQFKGQQGIWGNYVKEHLLPRLNGFELLMASYAMAHLKLDLLLKETGYKHDDNQRFRVFLTNSLEEHHKDTDTLFANWLSAEANEANRVKRDTPVMCVIGNPPYSGISSNKGKWIKDLIEDYKYVDGEHFKERKHWLNDDYVKFIRYGQHYIEKNGNGVLAFINPHGFLDNPTFRGMRWNLLKAFDKIYTIDLHGNSKKKETAPDGSADINVFDIQQGVSINIFVKTGKKKINDLGKVFHYDLYGKRSFKYDFLNDNSIKSIDFNELSNVKPNYFFVPKDFKAQKAYDEGFSVNKLFPKNSVGFVTANDSLNISLSENEQKGKIDEILNMDETSWRQKYNRPKDAQSWKYKWAKEDAEKNQTKALTKVSYRPFDVRYTLYTGNSGGLYARPTFETMQHFLKGENIGLALCKQFKTGDQYVHSFITNKMIESSFVSNKTSEITSTFPLYLYPEKNSLQSLDAEEKKRTPNLNMDIVKEIEQSLELSFVPERENGNLCFAQNNDELQDDYKQVFAPIDLLDYIYAVLHSPSYREKYKEFLKIDFPRVPYPKSAAVFWRLVKLGGELRQIHLLEAPVVNDFITEYPVPGNNIISRKITKRSPGFELTHKEEKIGRVWINDEQYFDKVPETAWNFYIGGYQPAQKWLKDRKNRTLEFDDILHYQKIIVALTETDRLMKEIDELDTDWG